jgi:ElaA protein
MAGPEVHVASFDELDPRTAYLLWQLRESVFVVEQQCPYPELDGRDLEPDARHVWVTAGDRPVAYLRLLEEQDAEAGVRVGRVLVAQSHRGQGLAELLMSAALELAAGRPVRLSAQAYLQRWYERQGFGVVGPEFLDDGIPHVPMMRP